MHGEVSLQEFTILRPTFYSIKLRQRHILIWWLFMFPQNLFSRKSGHLLEQILVCMCMYFSDTIELNDSVQNKL